MPLQIAADILLVLVATLAVWSVWTFNRLISLRNRLREAWSGIDVQLKRRHDLVPELVACVQAYRGHERRVLEEVTAARTRALAAEGVAQTGTAENGLTQGLRTLVAVVESYPELKADQGFRRLNDALVETEDQLQYARRYYNGMVRDLNILVESFPSRLVAIVFGFRAEPFFAVESAIERQTPEVRP